MEGSEKVRSNAFVGYNFVFLHDAKGDNNSKTTRLFNKQETATNPSHVWTTI